MTSKGILNELRKEMDEIKQKPLNKPEVCTMSWNEKYQLDNTILCLQEENSKLKKVIEFIKENFEVEIHYDEEFDEYTICFLEYDECLEEIAITGMTKYINKEEYELLKEYL